MLGSIIEGKSYIFYGKKGTGKTTMAVRVIRDFHERGLPVWLNFDINEGRLTACSDAPIYREDDPAGVLSMRGGLFVLDEAYLKLNSREWAKLGQEVFLAWTMARKLEMTIIVIAQSWMRIDKSIREVSDIAREMRGSSLFGYKFDYVDYEINEIGEIVKEEPKEYEDNRKGFAFIRRFDFGAFDTHALFGVKPPPKVWKSAIRKVEVLTPEQGTGLLLEDEPPVATLPTAQKGLLPPSDASSGRGAKHRVQNFFTSRNLPFFEATKPRRSAEPGAKNAPLDAPVPPS